MPFEDPFENLEDILKHIGHIEFFLDGMSPVDLARDQRTIFACQYALLVISEAANRLVSAIARHAYDMLRSFAIVIE